ncbi:kelch repeat-containing protein [candidate division KSB1 bacterium]
MNFRIQRYSCIFLALLLLPASNIFSQQWDTKTSMPTSRMRLTVGSVSNKLYAIGGFTTNAIRKVEEYTPATDSWTTKTPMPAAYQTVKCDTFDNKIYVVGDNGSALIVLEYDPGTNIWTAKSGTTTGRSDFAMAGVDGKLYVFGGWGSNQFLSTVMEYDIASGVWTAKTSMPTARAGAAATAYDGKIYVVGGFSFSGVLTSFEVYDPTLDSWASYTDKPSRRKYAELQAMNGKLYLFGGGYGSGFVSKVEEFDLLTETWIDLEDILTPRDQLGSGIVNNKIYAIGGSDGSRLSVNEEFNPLSPSPPTGLTAVAGNGTVQLTWNINPESDILYYSIFRSEINDFSPTSLDSIGRTSHPVIIYIDNEVQNNTTYYYKLAATNTSYFMSGFSDQVSAVPQDTTPPAAPQNFIVQPGDRQVFLSWSANEETDLKQYNIYRSLNPGFTPAPADSIGFVSEPDSTFTDNTILNGTTYYFRISALDTSYNESEFSSEATITPVDTFPPAAPQNLIGTGLNESVDLVWNSATEPDILQYTIYRSQINNFTPSSLDSIGFTLHPDTTYSDSSVTVGKIYYYKVSAIDSTYNISDFSSQVSAVPIDTVPPGIPQNVVVTDGDRFLDISWSSNTEADIDHYIIYRSLNNGFSPAPSDSLTLISYPDSTFRDSLVVVGIPYFYRLSAVDTAFNESGFSLQVTGTPYDSTAPAAPQDLIASDGPGAIDLFWSPNTEADLLQYTVFRSTTSGFTPVPGDSLTRVFPPDTSYIDSSATINVTYYYKISALDSFYQESSFSNEDSAAAFDPVPPAAPVNLIATGGNTLVDLIWYKNTEADLKAYIIYRSITDGFTPGTSDSIGVVLKPDTTFTDNYAVNDQTYFYKIVAIDSFYNYSDTSNQATATPAPAIAYPWQTKTAMTTARYASISGVLSGKIYTIGGEGSNANEEYDPDLDAWTAKTDLPNPPDREYIGGDVIADKLYIVGGSKGGTYYTTVEAYKASTDTWETITSMNSERRDLAVTTVVDKLYAIGGRRANAAYRDDVEEYDLAGDAWSYKTSMPTLRWGLATTEAGGKIYAIGGDNGTYLSTVEEYDPETNAWTTKTSMPTARVNLTASTVAGKIYAIGGEDATGYLDIVEIYDPDTDVWITGDSMLTARAWHSAAVINNTKIYAIGGINGTGDLDVNEVYDPPPYQPSGLVAAVEPARISLGWTANTESDMDYYVVYRSTSDGFTPTVDDAIAIVSSENISYSDADIAATTTYYYRISAVDSLGQESNTFSSQVSATTSNYALDLGSIDSTVYSGDTLTIPVTFFGNFNSSSVTSFQFTLSFDSTQIDGIDVDTTGFGSSALFYNNILPGEIRVAAAVLDTLRGSNKVMNIRLMVDNNAQRDTTVLQFSEAYFNEGVPVLDIATSNILIRPRYGDLSNNRSISSYDASLVLQNVVGMIDFSTGRSEKADVTYNGTVTALDAYYILLHSVGLIGTFPVEDSLFSKRSVAVNQDLSILVEQEFSPDGREFLLHLSAESVQSIASAYFDIEIGNTMLDWQGIQFDENFSHFMHAENLNDGIIRIAMTGIPVVEQDGDIFTLRFTLKGDPSGGNAAELITVHAAEINDVEAAVEITGSDAANIPKSFGLEQNYPNPFNPETVIMYQLPKASHVVISIYNILGQEVAALVGEQKAAGYYSIKWNGKNNAGISVAPGIYIYRMRTESYVKSRKMVLIK